MPIVTVLDLTFRPDAADEGLAVLLDALAATRAFDGCLGVETLVERGDPAHVVVIERWESFEHDQAYRAWRATSPDLLGPFLGGVPSVTFLEGRG
jgi:heme oxygenase (mycobilin-producing)